MLSVCTAWKEYPLNSINTPFAFILILCDEMQDWGRGNNKPLFASSKPKDFIALEWVEVKITDLPEVHFKISCTIERKKELIETLQKRLVKSIDSGLKLFINGELIL
jgi:hypothetical protein